MRVFPLSNWTELDVWEYILLEQIPVVPLYFAAPRPMIALGASLIAAEHGSHALHGEAVENIMSRMRSLGCIHCSRAVRSEAAALPGIIGELRTIRKSERQNRLIDHDEEGSMETKKREGYF
jgi:sulfate adenylyltransferase subunit 2